MNTQEQSQQIIVEHIVNIDTAAEHITAINSVADITVQLVAVAGMLPDIAGTVAMRSTLLAVAKKLAVVQTVADALPLLDAVRGMENDIRAALGARIEIASVVAHLDAVRSLAAQLDILLLTPQHAAEAKAAADVAAEAAGQISLQLGRAETARLGAELAENNAGHTAELAADSSGKAAASAAEARQAADAASAVSGLPDASVAAPGDPLIWNGTDFSVGTLQDSLQSVDNALGVAAPVLAAIQTAQHTADGVDAKATQAQNDAATAKNTAAGVDAKATQAQSDATDAKELAQSARTEVTAFSGRLSAAETETVLLGESQNAHSSNGDIHHGTAALVARINAAVSAGLDELRDNGTGSLPETRNTLQKLSDLLDAARTTLDTFLFGENAADRMAMLNAIETNRAAIAAMQGDLLLRSDLVDSLDVSDPGLPLSANQGSVLLGMVNRAQMTADSAAVPWVQRLEAVPAAWPERLHPQGLLLIFPDSGGDPGENPPVNPEWYINDRNVPTRLTIDASGIRLADGTTVQSGVASTLVAAQAAQTAATAAQTAAGEAKADAATARTVAEGVDAKAAAAQVTANEAKVIAGEAKIVAEEALSKSPDLATDTTPGIVKGSETVEIGTDGSVNVVGGTVTTGGAVVISPPVVTVPPQVGIGFPFDIQLAAGPVLLPGAHVAKYVLTAGNAAPVDVPAVSGAATFSHTQQGNTGDVLTVKAVAVDSMGNVSGETAVTVTIVDVSIAPAEILSPVENEQNISKKPVISLADMYVYGIEDIAKYVRVQIAEDEAFTQIIFDTGETFPASTSIQVPLLLNGDTSYSLRAMWTATQFGAGPWSATRSFRTSPALVVRACQIADGKAGQTWQRIDADGNALEGTPNFNAHTTYSGIVERVIDGQYMIGIPKCFVSRETLSTGTFVGKDARGLSDIALPGYEVHPAFLAHDGDTADEMIWIGKYQACDDGGTKVGSKPGVMPLINLNFPDVQSRCTARNTSGISGFHLWNIHELALIQLMMLLEYGSTNFDAFIGRGHVDNTPPGVQAVDSAVVAKASWRGIVGIWGNTWQMCDGLRVKTRTNLFKMNMGKGWVDTTISLGNRTIYPNKMLNVEGIGWSAKHLFIANHENSSSVDVDAAYPDGQNHWGAGASDCISFGGGCYENGSLAGLFALNCYDGSLSATNNVGSRLAKR